MSKGNAFSDKYGRFLPALLVLVLLAAVIASLGIGGYPMSAGRSLRAMFYLLSPFHDAADSSFDLRELTVMGIIRPPRVLLALLSGVALGMAGTTLQGLMRNPLVGPDIVGVTSGAGFGGAAALLLELPPTGLLLFAFCGGLLGMACTFGLARLTSAGNTMILILAGVFIGAFFTALTGLLTYYGNVFHIYGWITGSFAGADWTKVAMCAIPVIVGGILLMALRWRINLLSLGDIDAKSLGLNVGALRLLIIVIVSLMVSSQIAASGIVAWVGLVVPHCARMLVGPDHRRLLPTAALLGGLFVLGLDDLIRTTQFFHYPVGVLTALVGTPLACILLWKARGKGWEQ